MVRILIILVVSFIIEAFGVIEIKKGVDEVVVKYHLRQQDTPLLLNIVKMVGNAWTNKHFLFGLLLEMAFFVGLLYLLGQKDVSFVWPLTSLSFVMTTLAARFLLKEDVSTVRWAGVALIVFGAALISYSEHTKEKPSTAIQKTEMITTTKM
ncbi:MAG TPA: EamA family transporter [Verrucomicrobiota bacterium]|nr:EamA family transporter [Verrucomicrobiota bacterium]